MVAGILGISRVELDGTGSEIVLKIMLIAGGNNNNCGFIWRSSKWELIEWMAEKGVVINSS